MPGSGKYRERKTGDGRGKQRQKSSGESRKSTAEAYLEKHAFTGKLIDADPPSGLSLVITIPAYNESGLTTCLDSLFSCDPFGGVAEVIVLINGREGDAEEVKRTNREAYAECMLWAAEHRRGDLVVRAVLVEGLPEKHAGAGLARKIAMDEAVRRFAGSAGLGAGGLVRDDALRGGGGDQEDGLPAGEGEREDGLRAGEGERDEREVLRSGIIAGLDADCKVEANYLQALTAHFVYRPDADGCSIHFEHPLWGESQGKASDGDFPQEVYEAILHYELHLRVYLRGLRSTGYPYAYHTVGSSFAVRADRYCLSGGMNKRKAGEDFYFIQKVAALGNWSDCVTTTVYPSPRVSDRVPFGTGKAVTDQVRSGEPYLTYDPVLYEMLMGFYAGLEGLYVEKDVGQIKAKPKTAETANKPSGKTSGETSEVAGGEADGESQGESHVESQGESHVETHLEKFLSGLDPLLQDYLSETGFAGQVAEIRANSGSAERFSQRCMRKFNMFWMMKFFHFAEERGVERVGVMEAVRRSYGV